MSNADLDYNEFKKVYNQAYYLCGKLGFVADYNRGFMHKTYCNNWECKICRKSKQYEVYLEILKNVYNFGLWKHIVITFGGTRQRNNFSWDESYIYMNKEWDKLRKTINRKVGKLSYILLPRAHKDGYCHYHILGNKYLDWNWLNEKRKNYDLGYVSIQKNKSVPEYLCTDFFKDNEWWIPFGIKRYRTSRDIILRNWISGGIEYAKNIEKFKNRKDIPDRLKDWEWRMDFEEHCSNNWRIKPPVYLTEEELINRYIEQEKESKRIENEIFKELSSYYK